MTGKKNLYVVRNPGGQLSNLPSQQFYGGTKYFLSFQKTNRNFLDIYRQMFAQKL